MSAGANTGRIRTTVNRISEAFGYKTDLFVIHRAIFLTLHDANNKDVFNSLKRTSTIGVNFKIVSGISRMSWAVVNENWLLPKIKNELNRLTSLPPYPQWITLPLTGLAGASFCKLAGGSATDMLIIFVATIAGLSMRQYTTKLRFNGYLCIYFASLTATIIAAIAMKYATMSQQSFATAALFLVPGVPLINSFSDLIDGNLQNGIVRGFNGLIISFAIALGMITTLLIFRT